MQHYLTHEKVKSMLRERVDLFEFENKERNFLKKVCKNLEGISYPVVYAGSGDDVEHGILLGNELVFIDSHMPEVNLTSIKTKLELVSDIVSFERVSKPFPAWRFKVKVIGESVTLEYWCADATKVLPEKIGVYFIKVPLPKEIKVGCLCEESNLAKALSKVVEGGYYLERECPILPEKYGFKLILSGEISALSINSAKGNLYRKIISF